MTGFARASGAQGRWRFSVELKCVNAKGLDLRLRMPQGFDSLEAPARAIVAKAVIRGSCFATLTAQREDGTERPRIDILALTRLADAAKNAAKKLDLAPPTIEGLLSLRGVVTVAEEQDDDGAIAKSHAALLGILETAAGELAASRNAEGAALERVLDLRLDSIAALVAAADSNPARRPEAIRARLAQQVAALMQSARGFDENRLHQEAIILATKADVREELDRLTTHVGAVRALLAAGGSIGRRLDFLAQELAREANTLCAKANDAALTAQGLELRAEIEQFREQVQNIE